METTLVPLAKIRTDGGTQMRAEINDETVSEYAERYRADGKMPPLVVFYDGTEYWLADGFHRLHALRAANKPQAIAEVRSGSQRDAVLFACGANSGHGLRRTNADKRRAVETMLRDEEWSGWNDSKIARVCAVSDKTVASVRREVSSEFPKMSESRLVERNGKVYEQNTANIGKRPQREQTEAPAPYRDGGAPKRETTHEEPPRQEPKPVAKPAETRPATDEQRKEANGFAFAIYEAIDRAAILLSRYGSRVRGDLLTPENTEKLRSGISNAQMMLDELKERLERTAAQ